MTFTIFQTKDSLKKFPESPYDDNSFVFKNTEVESNFAAFRILSNSFTLCLPLNISEKIRIPRRNDFLSQVQKQTFDYIIFDFDCCSLENQNNVINYFKDYNCIIGESRSYNGVDNFNLKGIIRIVPSSLKELKLIFYQIKQALKSFGNYKDSVTKTIEFQAPILRANVLFNNDNGKLYEYTDLKHLDDYIPSLNKLDFEINPNHKSTIDICLDVFKKLGFVMKSQTKTGAINFERIEDIKKEKYFWYADSPHMMRNKDSFKSLNIFEAVKKEEAKNVDIQRFINYNGFQIDDMKLDLNNELKNKLEKFIRSRNDIITIRSFMGSGKTFLIQKMINELKNNKLKIMIITCRVTLAEDFAEKFGVTLYYDRNDKKNPRKYKKGDSVVCQFDSLHYYNINDFDVFIMDEFMSLIFYSIDSMSGIPACNSFLYQALQKRVILSDAFMCNYIFNFFDEERNIFNIINTKKDPATTVEIPDLESFKYYLINTLKAGHKVTISVTSLNDMKNIKSFLESYGYSVLTLSSETEDFDKNYIIDRLSEKGKKLSHDAIIFSPVLNVGVSILNDVYYHFHFDCGRSVDPLSSLQMIRRARTPKVIFYYVRNSPKYNFLYTREIEDDMIARKELKNTANLQVNKDGSMEISVIGKLNSKIELFLNYLKINPRKSFNELLGLNFDLKNNIKIPARNLGLK